MVKKKKNLPAKTADAKDTGSISGLRRPPGGGNGNPFQYSFPGEFHGQRSLAVTVHRVAKSRTRLSN